MTLSGAQITRSRTEKQGSILGLAVLQPKTVFACRINDTFATHDMVTEFDYDGVTAGAYGDVIPGQTIFIGSAAGLYDIGICRARKAFTATTIYIGETSEIEFDDDLYVTVVDAFDIWPRHLQIVNEIVYMDVDVAYSDQHENFDPVPILGGHVVLDVESYPESVTFPKVADCWVFDSTISATLLTATDGVVTDGASSNPTLTISSYPTNGYVRVKLQVTAANGKVFSAYRYVLVFDSSNRPIEDFVIESCNADADSGGWSARVILNNASDALLMRHRGLAVIYSKDYFDGELGVIGLDVGRENIWMSGWVFEHATLDDPEFVPTEFDIHSAHFWMQKMQSFITGVELATSTPAAWTEIGGLTVDRGLWHFLHWRTTSTMVMDVYLTGDTKYTASCESAAASLWAQVGDVAGSQILAIPQCDHNMGLFVNVPYNLIPEASRAAESTFVMDLESQDYARKTEIQWNAPSTSQINLSGISVASDGEATPLFSLSPGHTPMYLGSPDVIDNLLLSSQAQSNSLAGLIMGARNNPYPSIPVILTGNLRAFDIAPVQHATISLDEYTGVVIPRTIDYSLESGKVTVEVAFEGETLEQLSTNGDIPLGDGDSIEFPPFPPLPPLPPLPPIVPPLPPPVPFNNTLIILTDTSGVWYTTDTSAYPNVEWHSWNVGLEALYASLTNLEVSVVSGRGYVRVGASKIMSSPGFGYPWVTIFDQADVEAYIGSWNTIRVAAFGINRYANDEIAALGYGRSGASATSNLFKGTSAGLTGGVYVYPHTFFGDNVEGHIVYGNGTWMCGAGDAGVKATVANKACSTIIRETGFGSGRCNIVRGGVDGQKVFLNRQTVIGGSTWRWTDDDGVGWTTIGEPPVLNGEFSSAREYVGVDATGQYVVGSRIAPETVARSSDGGLTWDYTLLSANIFGVWNLGSPSLWVAGLVGLIYYTDDFWDTWISLTGNLQSFIGGLFTVRAIRSL